MSLKYLLGTAAQILATTRKDVWDSIYPKNEKGTPMYNASGKYVVVLNLMGQLRAVTVHTAASRRALRDLGAKSFA